MILSDDENGQVLLSGAFLFALAIAITAIMLNNMIYTSNVAYTGFSEQTIYDDASLKRMITDEINYEYSTSNGNQAFFTSNMTAFINTLNNLTLTKGVYVKNELLYFYNNPASSHPDVVRQQITVCGKNFNKSYTVGINYTKPSVPTENAARNNPRNIIIKLGINNLTSPSMLIVDVTNSTTYMPEPGVVITLFYDNHNLRDIGTTNEGGRIHSPLLLTSGTYNLHVEGLSQRSNDVTVFVS